MSPITTPSRSSSYRQSFICSSPIGALMWREHSGMQSVLECLPAPLFDTGRACLPHDPAPARRLGTDIAMQLVGRRALDRYHSEPRDLLADLGLRQNRFQLAMQLIEDVGRQSCARRDHQPGDSLIT